MVSGVAGLTAVVVVVSLVSVVHIINDINYFYDDVIHELDDFKVSIIWKICSADKLA